MGVGNLSQHSLYLAGKVCIIDRKGKAAVGSHLAGAQFHGGKGIQILFRNPGESLLILIIVRACALHNNRHLLLRVKRHGLALYGRKRLLVSAAIGINPEEANHRGNLSVSVDKHLLGVQKSVHSGAAKSYIQTAFNLCCHSGYDILIFVFVPDVIFWIVYSWLVFRTLASAIKSLGTRRRTLLRSFGSITTSEVHN